MQKPAKRHHFVPIWYLRNFAAGGQLHVLQKDTGRVFRSGLTGVAVEKDFYRTPELDDHRNGADPIAEKFLARVEAKCAAGVTRVLGRIANYVSRVPDLDAAAAADRGYSVLTSARDRAALATHVMLQLARTPARRKAIAHMNRILFEWAKTLVTGQDDVDISGLDPDGDPIDDRTRHIMTLFSDEGMIATTKFARWSFVFLANRSETPLYTSDTPVVVRDLSEISDATPLGRFVSRSIESKTAVYVPLSSSVLLIVYGRGEDEPLYGLADGLVIELPDPRESNGAQVFYSGRHVYCRDDAFDFARDVIADHPACADPERRFGRLQPMGEYLAELERRRLRDP